MSRRVFVIASGETERRALPPLVAHLACRGTVVEDVRVPPRHRRLDPPMAERLIKAAWFESANDTPDKFVVLVDVDAADPTDVLRPFHAHLPRRLAGIRAAILFAYAQRHLEAWFFADAGGLRRYLERDLGAVDASGPDGIANPKLHLKHLLGERLYTSRIAAEIASSLDAGTIVQRSASFRDFERALGNGSTR